LKVSALLVLLFLQPCCASFFTSP